MAKIKYNGKNGRLDIVMAKNEKMPLMISITGAGGRSITYNRSYHFDKFINATNNIERAIHINVLGTPY